MNRCLLHVHAVALWLLGAFAPLAGASRVARRGRHTLAVPPELNPGAPKAPTRFHRSGGAGGLDEQAQSQFRSLEDIAPVVEDMETRQKGPHTTEGDGSPGGLLAADLAELLRETKDDLSECTVVHQYAEPFEVGDAFHPNDRGVKLHLHGRAAEPVVVPPVFKQGAIEEVNLASTDLPLAVEMYAFLTESIGMVQVIPHGVVSKWTSKKKVPIAGFLCQHNGHHESAPVLHALSTPCVPTYLDRAGMPLSTDDKSFEVFVGSTRIKFDSEREAFKFCEDYSRRIARDLSATVWDASSLGDVMPQRSPTLGQFVALTRHLDTPQGWTRGRKSVLVVVMDWKVGDKSMSPYSQQEHNPIPNYRSKIFPAVNEAFTRMSYGQFGIEVTFVPEVIRYSRDRIAYTSRKMPFPSLYNAAKESMEGYTSQYRFDDYDLVFVIAPQVNPTGTKGVAWVGQKGAMCNGCETLSDSFKVMVAVHELGHNLGLKHASSSSLEYGNVFDWMGNYPDVVGLHYGLGYKWRLGWISDRSLYEIGDADLSGLSAEVELNPFDAETAPQGEQIVGVHVSLSGLDSDLWVSYRSSVAGDKQGVYVVYQDKDQTNSELVDAACGTISQQDAHLKVGWTFLEKSHKVAIKVLAVSATAAKVHVFAVGPADVSNLYAAPGFTDGVTRCPASCQDADLLVPQYSCAELQGMGYCGSGELTMMGHRYSIKGDICPATCGTCAAGASDSQSSGPAAAGGSPPAPAACKDVNVRISGKTCGGAARAGWCSMETTSGQTVGMDLCPLSCGQCPQSIEASSEPFVEPEITDTSGTVSFAVGGARSVGGAAPAKAAEFDCEAGLGKWEAGWSEAKKKWCCENEGKGWQGCKDESAEEDALFDCDAGLDRWEAGWSDMKKEWCCDNEKKGCKEEPFDCEAGLLKWKAGWSEAKKEWCCAKKGKGCEEGKGAEEEDGDAQQEDDDEASSEDDAENDTAEAKDISDGEDKKQAVEKKRVVHDEEERVVQRRGKPPSPDVACDDDPYWIDPDGHGCETYRETIEEGKWSMEEACEYGGSKMYCRKTCHTCVVSADNCADSFCIGEFMRSTGRCEQCSDYPRHCKLEWFRRDCPMTCGQCVPSQEALEATARSSASSAELNDGAVASVEESECRDDECVEEWKAGEYCPTCRDLGESMCFDATFSRRCKKTCNLCVEGGVPKECADVFSTYTCRRYRKYGWCEREDVAEQVRAQCPLSCGVCGPEAGEAAAVRSSAGAVRERAESDGAEEEACVCEDEWSSPHHKGCNQVRGCPSPACDGFNKTWCIVKNPSCSTRREGSHGLHWSYCTPDGAPEAKADAGPRGLWDWRAMYSAPAAKPAEAGKPRPKAPTGRPRQTPMFGAPGSTTVYGSGAAEHRKGARRQAWILCAALLAAAFGLA